LHRLRHKVALHALHTQAVVPYSLQMLSASNKYDFLSRLGQPTAKIASHATGAKDGNAHQYLLKINKSPPTHRPQFQRR
jgi:hypothetical protein